MAYCITKSMGRERIMARKAEWLASLWAGYKAAPKCGAKTRAGHECGRAKMRGGDRCHVHLHDAQRDIVDAQRDILARKYAQSSNKQRRESAERTLAAIARRRLHRSWKVDANLPGSTLALPDDDEQRVREWLETEHGIALGVTAHPGGHPISYRCIDRLRWAGALRLTERITETSAKNRVAAAMRDDAAWWVKRFGAET